MEAELVDNLKRAREGDIEAFAYVATAFRESAIGQAIRIVKDHYDAEDAAQEALMIALTKLSDLREIEAFPGWLSTIVRSTAIKFIRRRRPDLIENVFEDTIPSESLSPDQNALEYEQKQTIRNAIKTLNQKQRRVIEEHYLRGRKLEDISAQLGIPTGSVKRQLFEARENLRERLSGFAPANKPLFRTTDKPKTKFFKL